MTGSTFPKKNGPGAQCAEFPGLSSFDECQELFSNAPIGIFTSTPEGRFISVNPAMALMFGYDSPNEMIESITDIAEEYYIDPSDREEFVRQMHEQGQVVNHECRVRRRDGSIIWISRNSREIRDKNGKITHYQGFVADITERKRSERDLQDNKELLELITDNMRDMVSLTDLEGNFEFVGRSHQLLGYDPELLVGKNVLDFVHQEDLPRIKQEFKEFLHFIDDDRKVEYRYKRKDGSYVWLETIGRFIKDTNSIPVKILFNTRDITDRKRAEEALRKSEKRFQNMLALIPDMISIHDPDMNIIYSNWNGFAAVPPDKRVLNTKCYRTYRGYDRICHDCRAVTVLETKKAAEEEILLPDGSWVDLRIIPVLDQDRNVEFFVEWVRDITDIKRSEEELRDRERLLEGIINGVSDLLAIQYPDHSIERYNQAGYDLLKMTPEEVKGKKCFELLGRDCECEKCATRIALKTGKLEQVEKYVPELGIYLDCRSNPILDEDGRVVQVIEQLRDVTDHKRAEEALRESEERYRLLFEHSPLGVLHVDEYGVIATCNNNFVQIIGSSRHALIGLNMFNLPDKKLVGEVKKSLQGGIGFYEDVYHSVTSNKSTPVKVLFAPIRKNKGQFRGCVGIVEDITERKKYEEQLKYLSLHDQLTGLYNRVYLENELQRLQNSRDFPITIFCMDLDGLKLVNDTLGHDHGDKHLRDCAQILHASFRASDIVARFGGDEFVALLPRTDLKVGEKLVNRIRSRIEESNQHKSSEIPLSISIGLACAEKSKHNLLDVFKQADDRMYRDKLHRDITSRSQIMKGLMAALEERDFITSGHAHRLEDLCLNLGREIGLSSSQLSNMHLLAQVHDLGKVGIPDHILFKPGPLTDEEWQIMRQHPEKGYRIAQSTTDLAGISDLILKHHERWDGQGYPLGLQGEEIPIECRILAIVDAFDSMTNDRPYRKAMPVAEVKKELQRCAGSQFDPQLVQFFLQIMSKPDNNLHMCAQSL